MRKYLGECKGVVGEIAVVGVRTRDSKVLAMAASASSSTSSSPEKKVRKAETTPYDVDQLRTRRRVEENSATSSASFRSETSASDVVVVFTAEENCSSGEISSEFPASCSSCNGADEVVKDQLESVADPEVESALRTSKYLDCRTAARRENKLIGALKSDDLDSPPRHPDAKSTVQIKMPSDSEIEEFFAAAEKGLHKRFSEKYNFDVVKDIPLEGRYEWVPTKP